MSDGEYGPSDTLHIKHQNITLTFHGRTGIPLLTFPQFSWRGKNSAGISKHERQTVAPQCRLISHADRQSSAGINCCRPLPCLVGGTYRLWPSAGSQYITGGGSPQSGAAARQTVYPAPTLQLVATTGTWGQ